MSTVRTTTQPAAPASPGPAAQLEGAAIRSASDSPPAGLPLFQVYQAQEGDTVATIAARFGIVQQYVVANNAQLSDQPFIAQGESIIIPAGNGILHEVRYGETLADIAARYDVSVEAIVAFSANQIAMPQDVQERQIVFVPNAQLPAPTTPPVIASNGP